jgi:hypothetical protein
MIGGKNLTPVSELNGLEHPRLDFDLDLPQYCPTDHIGVNLPRLDRLMRLINIGDLHVNLYSGDVTKVEPEVTGFTLGGMAIASGRAKITPADLEDSSVAPAEENWIDDSTGGSRDMADFYRPRDGRIRLNISEIEDRVPRNKMRDASAWSSVLDQALREGSREAIYQVYLAKADRMQMELGIALDSFVALVYGAAIYRNGLPGIAWGASFHLSVKGLEYAFAATCGLKPKDIDKSILPVWHLDRGLAAASLNKVQKLVRPIS